MPDTQKGVLYLHTIDKKDIVNKDISNRIDKKKKKKRESLSLSVSYLWSGLIVTVKTFLSTGWADQ